MSKGEQLPEEVYGSFGSAGKSRQYNIRATGPEIREESGALAADNYYIGKDSLSGLIGLLLQSDYRYIRTEYGSGIHFAYTHANT